MLRTNAYFFLKLIFSVFFGKGMFFFAQICKFFSKFKSKKYFFGENYSSVLLN